jgi:hypothetical protein
MLSAPIRGLCRGKYINTRLRILLNFQHDLDLMLGVFFYRSTDCHLGIQRCL